MTDLFQAVILSGGLATRLRPLTEKIPKALIEINAEPFVFHQLRLLKKQGIRDVVICAGYLGEMIQDVVGDGRQLGMHVQYVFDGNKLLGTAGAIKKALPWLDKNFFTLYGDSYLPCDYATVQEKFLKDNKQALMTVFCNQGQWDKSNVEYSQGEILVYDKHQQTSAMQYIDYGLGVFAREAFDRVPDETVYDLALLYQQLLKDNQLTGFEVGERFYEVGSFSGIQELNQYLKRK